MASKNDSGLGISSGWLVSTRSSVLDLKSDTLFGLDIIWKRLKSKQMSMKSLQVFMPFEHRGDEVCQLMLGKLKSTKRNIGYDGYGAVVCRAYVVVSNPLDHVREWVPELLCLHKD